MRKSIDNHIRDIVEEVQNEEGHARAWGGGGIVTIVLVILLLILIF